MYKLKKEVNISTFGYKKNGFKNNEIQISLKTDGAVSFFNLGDGDSYIYLYPRQLDRLLTLLKRKGFVS